MDPAFEHVAKAQLPVLDAHGALEFNFGATLQTRRPGGGNFRGRIPMRIEYN